MPRKKSVPVEEQSTNPEALGLPEAEAVEDAAGLPEKLSDPGGEETSFPTTDGMDPSQDNASAGEGESPVPGGDPDPLPEDGKNHGAPALLEGAEGEGTLYSDPPPDLPMEGEGPQGETVPLEGSESEGNAYSPEGAPSGEVLTVEGIEPLPAGIPEGAESGIGVENGQNGTAAGQKLPGPAEGVPEAPQPDGVLGDDGTTRKARASTPQPKSDRQRFYDLDFNELDRDLTPEERQAWNSIYASYRGRSALSGQIIGVDPHSIVVRDRRTGEVRRETMYCAIVILYRVQIVIPASEMWERGQERPDFVFQNTVGSTIDFIITEVDREGGFAVASRRLAARSQRYFFAHRESLCREGARVKCRVLAVGPRRCLVECYGHDINLTQRELRYTAIPDLRDEYRPGKELECIVKGYDPEKENLQISVKETEPNPFEGAELRHPPGCRRQAVIAGKYGGGVFCNLPDDTVCMCNYSYQHEDSDFQVGDTAILVVQRYDREKRQIYGKILSKW